jgi:prevent-host-death family protein
MEAYALRGSSARRLTRTVRFVHFTVAKKTYGADEARTQLPKLLELAHRGTTTVITRRGKPYAVVAPVDHVPERRTREGLLTLRGSGKGFWGSSSARGIRRMRDEWS